MDNRFSRTALMFGEDLISKFKNTKIAVFGIGGVGSYVVEALARCGIGHFLLVDKDVVDVTNINRQIIALSSTIGRPKTEVAKERILDINPNATVEIKTVFYNSETADTINFSEYDYIIDAIDTVTSKLLMIEQAKKSDIPIISCMGTGGKKNPSLLEVTDIKKTNTCPLAKVMRKELKDRGIDSLKVVYSPEKAVKADGIIPSNSFVPSSAGLLIASEVINDLSKI